MQLLWYITKHFHIGLKLREVITKAMGLCISHGIGIPFQKSSQSWIRYWANQPEVLFFGLYSEISGGQMPNKVTGSSDYLTVSGSAGAETYQCPNTAAYVAADTDYIWFKTDASQRTTTTAELIGHDLQRTPVKYEDESPNEIVAIIILNAAVTGVKRDRLFKDMILSSWWDNSLNDYGHIKDNRSGEQLLWKPEAVIPAILTDEHTLTYLDYNKDYTLNGNLLTRINDSLGSGNDFVNMGGTPEWDADNGIRLNSEYIQTDTLTLGTPFCVYLLIKPTAWTNLSRIFDGGADGEPQFSQNGTTPNVVAGSVLGWSAQNNQLTLNEWHLVRIKIKHGTGTCKLQIDNNSAITFNCVANTAMTKITIGSRYSGANPVPLYLKDAIFRNIDETDNDWNEIGNYLLNKY